MNIKELNNRNNFPFTKRRNTSYAVLIPHRSFSFDGILLVFRLSVLFLFALKVEDLKAAKPKQNVKALFTF